LLFVLPIALVGWLWGLRAAVGAAVLAKACLVVVAVFAHGGMSAIGYVSRATAFLTVALLASVAGGRATQALHGDDGLQALHGDDGLKEFSLTAREAEVLEIMAEGASNSEISQRLTISESTAKSHVKSVLRKLGVRNRTQAVLLYLEHQRGDRLSVRARSDNEDALTRRCQKFAEDLRKVARATR
jgi:DNA-binding CsgD family transcriptional regulator